MGLYFAEIMPAVQEFQSLVSDLRFPFFIFSVFFSFLANIFYLCRMNQLVSHIEFLLHTHHCVIVPGLGGFVVNTTPAQRDGLSVFHPPKCELAFNRDLSHNDGLLVESYMRADKISFEAASQKIEESVRQIKSKLREQESVDLGDLGSFHRIDEQRFMYRSRPFVRPEHFGFSDASLKPVIHIQPKAPVARKSSADRKQVLRKISVGAAAAVIALIVLFFPMQDSTLHRQTAQIFSESGLFGRKPDKTAANTHAPSTSPEAVAKEVSGVTEIAPDATIDEPQVPSGTPKYYIVLGVYQVRKVAEDRVALLRSEGFTSSSVLERPNRIDVYTSFFHTREEAEENLGQLRQKYPHHRDAWVLKR